MGVEGWHSFTEAIRLLKDDPAFVHEAMAVQARFAASLAERILGEVEVDGIIFHEPIASNHGPLISPKMYDDFVLKSYAPVLDVAERFNVKTIILRTYANARALLPVVFKSQINTLWACECNSNAMDYCSLRAEFGPGIRLIGGIDADVLRQSQDAIRKEVDGKVLPLLAQGGFVPLADGRVRADVPFENYAFYRRYLETIIQEKDELLPGAQRAI
jgi:uroporphyrinogen-III decarboxylase